MASGCNKDNFEKNTKYRGDNNEQTKYRARGSIVLNDLPLGSSISLDLSSSYTLRQHEPIIVLDNITPANTLHFLSISSPSHHASTGNDGGFSSTTPSGAPDHCVGLIFLFPSNNNKNQSNKNDDDWCVTNRYDRYNEEPSSSDDMNDDILTRNNLMYSIRQARMVRAKAVAASEGSSVVTNIRGGEVEGVSIDPSKIIPYDQITGQGLANLSGAHTAPTLESTRKYAWNEGLVSFISSRVLKRHNLKGRGDKVLPGQFNGDNDDDDKELNKIMNGTKFDNDNHDDFIQDERTLVYPAIPCLDPIMSAKKLASHSGTRKYLASLPPSARTELFLLHNQICNSSGRERDSISGCNHNNMGGLVLDRILCNNYDGSWEILLGEWQLSFVVFLALGCLPSLTHWRDTLSMLSLAGSNAVGRYHELYKHLLKSIIHHIAAFNSEIVEDAETSEDTFIVPTLKRLYKMCSKSVNLELVHLVETFVSIVKNNLSISLNDDETDGMPYTMDQTMSESKNVNSNVSSLTELMDDSDSDSDGPAFVSLHEIEASNDRLRFHDDSKFKLQIPINQSSGFHENSTKDEKKNQLQKKFPLLHASAPYVNGDEDILMTCARVLDEANDVSLVREAKEYLITVESKRCHE